MSHIRQQIREAVGTLLGVSMVSYRHVFESRIPRSRDVLPYLLVYIDSEVSEPLTIHPSMILHRDLVLSVVAHVRIPQDKEIFEDTLDTVAAEIESKLTFTAINALLSNKVKSLVLQSTLTDIVTDDTDRTYAVVALEWQVQVDTIEGDSETLI